MIAFLRGRLIDKQPTRLIVDVQGVGYEVHVPLSTFYELAAVGTEVSLHIHTHVREDQLTLFGFLSLQEKILFLQLLKVNGVGPKLAMTLLSGLTPHEMSEAIARGDAAKLKSIPGIGQKTAERIILDLKDKILTQTPSAKTMTGSHTYDEALSALTHLGYTQAQAERALGDMDWSSSPNLKETIRQGLKNLARS